MHSRGLRLETHGTTHHYGMTTPCTIIMNVHAFQQGDFVCMLLKFRVLHVIVERVGVSVLPLYKSVRGPSDMAVHVHVYT